MSSDLTPPSPGADPDPSTDADLERMADISAHLRAVAVPAVQRWVVERVTVLVGGLDAERAAPIREAAALAAERAGSDVDDRLAELFAQPVADQATTPLAILRSVYRYPTAVLADAGARPIQRDAFEVRANPDDLFGLAPGSWGDFGDEVLQAGMAWGAAKAYLHKRDRQRLGGD